MTYAVLVAVAATVTVGSRVVALAVVPQPRGVLADIVARLPAPLFAALAAVSAIGSDRAAGATTVASIGAALLVARSRSLLAIVVAGLTAFVVTSSLT